MLEVELKKLRAIVAEVALFQSLRAIQSYLQFIQFREPIPIDVQVPYGFRVASKLNRLIHQWELEVLVRELLMHAPEESILDFRRQGLLVAAVDQLRALENAIAEDARELHRANILIELYRMAHRQFPWQTRHPQPTLTRYYKIFSRPALNRIVEARFDMSARSLYSIGLAILGHYLSDFVLVPPVRAEMPGVIQIEVDSFIARFAVDVPTIRQKLNAAESIDEDYAYSFNPLKVTPLVRIYSGAQEVLVAPIPTYLLQRFTEGIYYDVVGTAGFANAFGSSYQEYVGEVIRAANVHSAFLVTPECEYHIGRKRKDSVDWIVSDRTAHLFIECKAKRVRFESKIALADLSPLQEDFAALAEFVVQMYRTLEDAKANMYPVWRREGLPIFPVVVTLEDWYVFGGQLRKLLDEHVLSGLEDSKIDVSVLEEHPYTICSVETFERAIQVMAQATIASVMKKKTTGEWREWEMQSVLTNFFLANYQATELNLFRRDFEQIGPQSIPGPARPVKSN